MKTKDNSYGWSTEAVFLKNNTEGHIPEFQDKNEALKFGMFLRKKREFGIPNGEYPDELYLEHENLCKNGKENQDYLVKER